VEEKISAVAEGAQSGSAMMMAAAVAGFGRAAGGPGAAPAGAGGQPPRADENLTPIPSRCGTFYGAGCRTPTRCAGGQQREQGHVVCIIEAMKC
jgi:biotin carboxyl carrier protein